MAQVGQTAAQHLTGPAWIRSFSATGYAGLLAAGFLAATVLPLSSEALVVAMAAGGFNASGILAAATVGNVLGALVNYLAGRWGRHFWALRRQSPPPEALARAEHFFGRWGSPVLFFAFLPVVGDPLTLAAGVLRIGLPVFLFWVTLGKMLRYALLIFGVAFWPLK